MEQNPDLGNKILSPALFDRKLLALRRKRRQTGGLNFFYTEIAHRLCEDLSFVGRDFGAIADISADNGILAGQLRAQYPGASIVSLDTQTTPNANSAIADIDFLPLAKHSVDLVISNLSLHLVNDVPGVMAQIRRALKPDGLFMAAFVGGDSLVELRQCLMDADIEFSGGSSARVIPLPDFASSSQLLSRAEFALPVAHHETITIAFDNMFDLLRAIRESGNANFMVHRAKKPLRRDMIARAAELYTQRFSKNGKIGATAQIIYLTGWAPADSQPKAMRPGSATHRLADALNTVEHSTGDKTGL